MPGCWALVDRFEIARALQDIATLLTLKRDSRFKSRAYRRAANALESTPVDVGELVDSGRLTELDNVGDAIARTIAELWLTGRSSLRDRLANELPPGVLELYGVPGLTINRIRALGTALGITSLAELRKACEEGRVRHVRGFGPRTEQRIRDGIELFLKRRKRVILSEALGVAERLSAYLRGSTEIERVEVAGDVRRRVETTDTIELVAAATDIVAARAHFTRYPGFVDVADDGTARLPNGLTVTLEIVAAAELVAAVFLRTGSAAHLRRLAEIAQERSGAGDGDASLRAATRARNSEPAIYQSLGLDYVPPELREDTGEIEAASAHKLGVGLVSDSDVIGMVHCHTTHSDGVGSIEEMARAAEELGMAYITITDHSPSAHYAGGLSIERLLMQWQEIDEVQPKLRIRIFRGTEADILAYGRLDYPDDVLAQLDVVIASVHGRMGLDAAAMTARLERAMRHPCFKIWGHALGRLLLRRPPFACDVERVLDVISESRAAIEINGDPHRLDLEPRWARAARERGIRFVISTDAHSTRGLRNLRFGVMMARRAGLRRDDVLNSLAPDEFLSKVRPL